MNFSVEQIRAIKARKETQGQMQIREAKEWYCILNSNIPMIIHNINKIKIIRSNKLSGWIK